MLNILNDKNNDLICVQNTKNKNVTQQLTTHTELQDSYLGQALLKCGGDELVFCRIHIHTLFNLALKSDMCITNRIIYSRW